MEDKLYKLLLIDSPEINEKGDLCLFHYGLNIAGVADIGFPKKILIAISDEEVTDGCLYLNPLKNEVLYAIHCQGKSTHPYPKVIATSSKSITPNCWIDLIQNYWIIEYYNDNGELPEIEFEIRISDYAVDDDPDSKWETCIRTTAEGSVCINNLAVNENDIKKAMSAATMKTMEKILLSKNKPFIVANVRDLLSLLEKEEISFGKMVELMNEISLKWHDERYSLQEMEKAYHTGLLEGLTRAHDMSHMRVSFEEWLNS